jgi:hypothetical protein
MSALAMLTGVGSIVEAARSVAGVFSKSRAPSSGAAASSFASQLDKAIARFVQGRDKNGNGSLSLTEFGGDKKTFANLDVNRDGELSVQELRGLFAPADQAARGTGSLSV